MLIMLLAAFAAAPAPAAQAPKAPTPAAVEPDDVSDEEEEEGRSDFVPAPPDPAPLTPPPMIVALPAPGTVPVQAVSLSGAPDRARIDRFQMTISRGSEQLWQGEMRVNGLVMAAYEQNFSSAAPLTCTSPARGTTYGQRLSVNFSQSGAIYHGPDDYQLGVGVTEHQPAPNCSGSSTRSQRIDEQVTIVRGQTIRVTGEAGLVVRIHRL